MIDEQTIKKIVSDGITAPSGENCQPWRFVFSNSELKIYNIPEADQSLYNFGQRGSYVSHGALIENISISSKKHGYNINVTIFPHKEEKDLVSLVTFSDSIPENDPLYDSIHRRHTNRKDHHTKKIPSEIKSELFRSISQSALGELKIIDDEKTMHALGEAMAVNDMIIFENKHLHEFFYGHILWKEHEQHKAGGFYVKTLEFLPHQLKAVKLLKNKLVLKILNRLLKVSKKIANENSIKYSKSGALAAIVINGGEDQDFVNSGRLVERVWLEATRLGLSVHPCTGVLYFMERINGGDTKSFSEEHTSLIKKAYNTIEEAFGAKGKRIPMLFRLGYSDSATAKALRMLPNLHIK